MASEKTGHREPSKEIIIEKLIQFFTQEFGESASRKTQLDHSDQSPGTSSDWFKKHEHRVKITPPVNEASTSTGKRICSVGIDEQHDSDVKKARRQSITDPELRYRCSFCSQRFPSLTNVRDHTRACHREENERRKEERLNTSTKAVALAHKNVEPEVGPKLTQSPESHIHLFRCIACKFASVSYDHMIEHCQNHVIKFENPEANIQCDLTKKYVICGEKFDIDFDTYNECADGLNHSYTYINCDYNLLKHDKWPGIFTNLPKSEMDKINCTSIYYFTRIIRLTSRKKPASVPFMVFQCKKCMKYIDPQSILAHVQENSCKENNADYPCHICKKPFLNENTMYLHHKRHKAADNLNVKFTKVSFNNYDDDALNAVLLKAAGYTMNIVPCKTTQKGLSTDLAIIRTEVKNNQTIQKAAIDIQSAESGSKTVMVSQAADKMLFKCDARSIIIQGTKTGGAGAQNKTLITSTATKEIDKIDTVYKCKCELCFHGLEFLLKHLEICHSDSKSTIISCMCGLLFNEQQYQIHYGIHSQGFTKLNVKKITVVDEEIVALTNKYNTHVDNKIKQIEYSELCRKAIAKLVYTLQNVALAHVKGYKKEELTKQKIIAAAANRSVSSATDDLTKAKLMKTQGTMTEKPIHEVDKVIANKNQASYTKTVGSGTDDLNTTVTKSLGTMTTPERQSVYMVNKGVDTIKQVCLTKTVGLGTDDLNITVMKSQGTMTIETQTVQKVNKGVDNINSIQVSQTKSVGLGTDDLNITVMKSQGTMTLPETQTVQTVNKGVDNIIRVSQTKSVVSGTDDLNMSVMRSQGTRTLPETQTVQKVNKGFSNVTQVSQTKSDVSGTDDLNMTVMRSQGTRIVPETQTVQTVNKGVDNIIPMSQTKSVVSGTGDLNITVMKSQGTRIVPETQTVQKVNKGFSNVTQVSQTKSDVSGTDDLNMTVMRSQGTRTLPETQTVQKVNKGFSNIIQVSQTKSDVSGTDDLNMSVMKSQGTRIVPETQTVQKVNKGVDNVNIIQVSQTKSVVSGTDDLNMSVMRSQGTINTSVTQTVHEVNKDLGNTEEEEKPKSSLSRTHDFYSLILKAQEANEANIEITNTVKSAAENLVKFKRINDINIKYDKLNQKFYSGSDNTEENQSIVESTLAAEKNEITIDKTKVNCDTESTESKKESGNISTTKYEDCNKTVIKEFDKKEKVHMNKNQAVNIIEQQAEKYNTIVKIIETNESVKDRDIKTAEDNADSKIYTEDELLSGPEMPIYFDAEESILTDDEDPILLYEDDDD